MSKVDTTPETVNPVTVNKVKIGIVHPSAEVCQGLRHTLSQLGYQVTFIASSLAEQDQFFQQESPDLLFLQDELSHCQSTDENCVYGNIPQILIRTQSSNSTLAATRHACVIAVLEMPIGWSDLIPMIPLALRRFQELRSLRDRVRLLEDRLESDFRDGM